jgi:hypothetical protein
VQKKCSICGEKVETHVIECPKCGRGVFESEKTHHDLTNTTPPTSVRGQPPGYKEGDFVNVYPHSLVVCTELPNSFFSSEEGNYWIIANRNIAIGSFLGIQSRERVDAYMAKLKVNTFICADCSVSEITSGAIDQEAIKLVSASDEFVRKTGMTVEKRKYRIVPMLCEDAFKKTSWVRYCWFFD